MTSSDTTDLSKRALTLDARVRAAAPLVHHITNYVVMNFTANVTLALGAQPVMAHAPEELEQMQAFASSLVINIGTLERAWIESMRIAGKAATGRGTPIVLDPVGAGATTLRTETTRQLLDELSISVLRGNAGEVLAVAGDAGRVRGVDSLADAQETIGVAQQLAAERKMIVAMTGVVDIVTDGTATFEIRNGHALMGRVTGTGCAASATVGAFVAAAGPAERCFATAAALAVYGRAGEIAAQRAYGPGSFVPELLDTLYRVPEIVEATSLHIRQVG